MYTPDNLLRQWFLKNRYVKKSRDDSTLLDIYDFSTNYAINSLRLDHRIHFTDNIRFKDHYELIQNNDRLSSTCMDRHSHGLGQYQEDNDSIVFLDVDTKEFSTLLLGRSSGKLSMYNNTLIQEKYAILSRNIKENNLNLNVNNLDNSTENINTRNQYPITIPPTYQCDIFPSVSSTIKKDSYYQMTTCKWLPKENHAIITASNSHGLAIWDLEYNLTSKKKVIPIFNIKYSKGLIHYISIYGEYKSMNALNPNEINSNLINTSYSASPLIACCCTSKFLNKSSLILVDIRVNSIADEYQIFNNEQNINSNETNSPTYVTWYPNNAYLIVSGHSDGSIRIWDIRKSNNEYLYLCNMHSVDDQFPRFNANEQFYYQSRSRSLKQCASSLYRRDLLYEAKLYEEKMYTMTQQKQKSLKKSVPLHIELNFENEDAMWNCVKSDSQNTYKYFEPLSSKKNTCFNIGGCKKKKNVKTNIKESDKIFTSHPHSINLIHFVLDNQYFISSSSSQKELSSNLNNSLHLWNSRNGKFCPIYYEIPQGYSHNSSTNKNNENRNPALGSHKQTIGSIIKLSKGQELFLYGINDGVAIYDTQTGTLQNYYPLKDHLPIDFTITIPGNPLTPFCNIPMQLITAGRLGNIVSWTGDKIYE